MQPSLLQKIDRFLAESGLPPTLFGRRAVRDPRLVSDLRNGREAGTKLIARVEYFINNWRAERAGDGGC